MCCFRKTCRAHKTVSRYLLGVACVVDGNFPVNSRRMLASATQATLGVLFKISDKHPLSFDMGQPRSQSRFPGLGVGSGNEVGYGSPPPPGSIFTTQVLLWFPM